MTHGLNANLVRQWRAGRGVKLIRVSDVASMADKASKPSACAVSPLIGTGPGFVAIEMPVVAKPSAAATREVAAGAAMAEPVIHVELHRGPVHLNIRWPTSAAQECTTWLRELTAGLLK